jgi:hypothetical protein
MLVLVPRRRGGVPVTWWAWVLVAVWYVATAVGLYRMLDIDRVDRWAVGVWCAAWPLLLLLASCVRAIEAAERGKH